MGFGLFQDVTVLFSYLEGLCKVLASQVILLPELIYQTDAKERFADTSGIVQRFQETQSLLLIGEGFLIFPLALCAKWQGTTLHNGYCSGMAVGLTEQTQGVREALLILSRFGDLFCLEDSRKHEICLASEKEVIYDESPSIQKQELEAILLRYLASF